MIFFKFACFLQNYFFLCLLVKCRLMRDTDVGLSFPSGERPFHCTLCEKAFNQKSALQVHMKKHTGERPYKCDYCVMGFTQKSNMKLHMKRAHSYTGKRHTLCLRSRAFKCPVTDRAPQWAVSAVSSPQGFRKSPSCSVLAKACVSECVEPSAGAVRPDLCCTLSVCVLWLREQMGSVSPCGLLGSLLLVSVSTRNLGVTVNGLDEAAGGRRSSTGRRELAVWCEWSLRCGSDRISAF